MGKPMSISRRGHELGFSREEVRTLPGLAGQPQSSCEEADLLVQAHLLAIEARIRDLLSIRVELSKLAGVRACRALPFAGGARQPAVLAASRGPTH